MKRIDNGEGNERENVREKKRERKNGSNYLYIKNIFSSDYYLMVILLIIIIGYKILVLFFNSIIEIFLIVFNFFCKLILWVLMNYVI